MVNADDDTSRSHGQAARTEARTGADTPVPDQAAPRVDDGDETGEFRPGPDPTDREQRLDNLVVSYLEAVERGAQTDPRAWAARDPELAAELMEFVADQDQFQSWAEPLREIARVGSTEVDVADTTGDGCRLSPPETSVVRLGDSATIGDESPRPSLEKEVAGLGGYELLGEIARGGMGVVFRARQIRLQRIVALKMILVGRSSSPEALQDFRREAEAAAQLDHPNIVPIYEVGERDGLPYFSMKLIDGGDLDASLRQSSRDPRAVTRVLAIVARAVHHAHERGILHRDLKPGNILLDRQGEPHVTDFGLAKRFDHDSEASLAGRIVGTPKYMAPEQAAGQKGLTTAADVYSLGVILYQMLADRPPFVAEHPLEILRQVIEEEPLPPRTFNPHVDRDLETICLKCLRKEPAGRYASALALAEDLERVLAGEPIQARPVTTGERAWKWARRRPAAAALVCVSVAAAVLLLIGGALYQEQRARVAENELSQHRRLAEQRSRGQEFLAQAEAAMAREDWPGAKGLLLQALAQVGAEAALAGLGKQAQLLLGKTDRQLADRETRDRAVETYRRFFAARDEALFHGSGFTGVDLPGNLKATQRAAREALGLVFVDRDPIDPRTAIRDVDPYTPQERNDLTSGCYEVLLILAEAVAADDPPQHLDEAVRLLDRASQLAPPTRAYHVRRARYLQELGREGDARKERESAEACQPTRPLDFFLLGDDLQRREKLPEAIRAFENALALRGNDFWARYFLAIGHLRLGGPGHIQIARAHLDACINQRPDDFVYAYILRGFARGRLQEFTAAEADFDEALKRNPNDDATYAILVNRGVFGARQGQFEEAVAHLKHAIALKPDQYQAYANLANVYQGKKDLVAAANEADKALEVAGRQAKAKQVAPSALAMIHRNRAQLGLRRGDADAALRALDRALELAPRAEDHAERGRILLDQKRYPQAATAYEAALHIRPAYPQAHRGRAEALLELRRYAEALRSLDQYLKDSDQDARKDLLAGAYLTRGLIRARLNDASGAIDDYGLALRLKPDAATYAYRGWAHVLSEAPLLAVHDFEEAIRLQPDPGDTYNGRGYARAKLGRLHDAISDAEEALRRGPQTDRLLYNAARIYAQAAGRVGAQGGPRNRRLATARSGYETRAVALVHQALGLHSAIERRAFWQRFVGADAALNPIRRNPGFARLAAEYSRGIK